MIKEEVQLIRVKMGHEDESFDEFVEAHKTCLNDMMYFPTRDAFGLSSVAGNMEKLSALQYEFENVKKRMDDDTKKAQRIEQKIKLLTNGYQVCREVLGWLVMLFHLLCFSCSNNISTINHSCIFISSSALD